jgi:CubicO group peptidase (beta-lactamase class C family)
VHFPVVNYGCATEVDHLEAGMICDAAFAEVVAAFREGLGNGGGALAVISRGRVLVDVWGGTCDEDGIRWWERDTVANVFSVSKGVLATVANLLVERGSLDLDASVRRYWPEFRADTTVQQLLSHQAGLAAIADPLPPGSAYDWTAMTTALAEQEPWWTPGTGHGYHAVTFGWLVGELIRRVTGEGVADVVASELGGLDLWIGLPRAERRRVAFMPPAESGPMSTSSPLFDAMRDPDSLTAKAFTNPVDLLVPGAVNTDAWWDAQIPAVNGHATARALATMYDNARPATTAYSEGPDRVLFGNTRFGLGYMLPNEVRPFSPNPRAFGHTGAGGSMAFADADAGFALGFVTNRLIASAAGPDPRWPAMLDALYARV